MKKYLYTILTFIVIVAIWYKVSLTANPLFVPNPVNVFEDFIVLLSDGKIFIHFWYTFKRIMIATCLSGIIALPLGLFIYNSKIAKATIYPVVMLLQIITRIQLPSTLPSILNGFVMMIGIGWTYCAVVETINAKYGLGYIIHQSTARGKTDLVFMSIIVIMIVSFVLDNLCKLIIRHVFKWRYLNER